MNIRLRCPCGAEIEIKEGNPLIVSQRDAYSTTPEERALNTFRDEHRECIHRPIAVPTTTEGQ